MTLRCDTMWNLWAPFYALCHCSIKWSILRFWEVYMWDSRRVCACVHANVCDWAFGGGGKCVDVSAWCDHVNWEKCEWKQTKPAKLFRTCSPAPQCNTTEVSLSGWVLLLHCCCPIIQYPWSWHLLTRQISGFLIEFPKWPLSKAILFPTTYILLYCRHSCFILYRSELQVEGFDAE